MVLIGCFGAHSQKFLELLSEKINAATQLFNVRTFRALSSCEIAMNRGLAPSTLLNREWDGVMRLRSRG